VIGVPWSTPANTRGGDEWRRGCVETRLVAVAYAVAVPRWLKGHGSARPPLPRSTSTAMCREFCAGRKGVGLHGPVRALTQRAAPDSRTQPQPLG
jgi:hypothetical protein